MAKGKKSMSRRAQRALEREAFGPEPTGARERVSKTAPHEVDALRGYTPCLHCGATCRDWNGGGLNLCDPCFHRAGG